MSQQQPTLLLLGGGYVLSKVASLLPPGSFVITSRREETVLGWLKLGWCAERVDSTDRDSIDIVLTKFPYLSILVDSVPPQHVSSDRAYEQEAKERVSVFGRFAKAIYLSTTGVFGIDDGSWVDENTPCRASLDRPLARIAFENQYRNSFANFSALRIPAIYGPGRGIGHALREKRYALIEKGERWSNRIHRDDLAEAIIFTLNLVKAPPIICVSDTEPTRSIEVVNFYCKGFNLPFPMSISLDQAKARGLHTMISNQRVNSSFLREKLGFKFKLPSYREGARSEFESEA